MLGREYLKQKVIQNKNNNTSSKFNMSNVEKKLLPKWVFFLKMWHNKSMLKIRKIFVRVTQIELVIPTKNTYIFPLFFKPAFGVWFLGWDLFSGSVIVKVDFRWWELIWY